MKPTMRWVTVAAGAAIILAATAWTADGQKKFCPALVALSHAIDRYDVGATIQREDIQKWNDVVLARNAIPSICKEGTRK